MTNRSTCGSRLLCLARLFLIGFLACIVVRPEVHGAQMHTKELSRVRRAGDLAAKRFYETLDFGTVFGEWFVSDISARRRTIETFLREEVDPVLLNTVDYETLRRAFVADLNVVYLTLLYKLSHGDLSRSEEVHLPTEVKEALNASPYFRRVLDENQDLPFQPVRTRAELTEMSKQGEAIAELLRKHLSGAAKSHVFRKNMTTIRSDNENGITVRYGDEEFSLNEEIKVFSVTSGFFQFFLIEEQGALRVLTIGIAN